MKRNSKREHGAITVFLSFVMAVIIAFMGMLVDIARLRVSESQVKRAAQLALDSTMTQYSRRLREDYGLFGYGGGEDVAALFKTYYEKNLDPDAETPTGDFYALLQQFTGGKIRYGDLLEISPLEDAAGGKGSEPISEPDVLYRQIVEFCKFRIPLTLALSDKLSQLTAMREAVESTQNDMQSVNETMKLGKPMEAYADGQKELEAAVKELNEAMELMNEAIDQWNELVSAKVDGLEVTSDSFRAGAYEWNQDNKLEHVAEDEYQYMLVISSQRYNSDGGSGRTVRFGPVHYYSYSEVTAAFRKIRDKLPNDLVDEVFSPFERPLNTLSGQVNAVLSYIDQCQDIIEREMSQEEPNFELISELQSAASSATSVASFYSDNYYSYRSRWESDRREFQNNIASVIRDLLEKLSNVVSMEVRMTTQTRRDNRNAARDLLKKALGRVDKAMETIAECEDQATATIDQVSDTLEQRYEANKCSQETLESWRDGDVKAARDTFLDERNREASLKEDLEKVTTWLNSYDEADIRIEGANISDSFMNACLSGLDGGGSWDGAQYRLSRLEGEDLEYDPHPDKQAEEKLEEAKGKAKEKEDKGREIQAQDEEAEKVRYNPRPLSKDLKAHFLTVNGTSEDSSIGEPSKPSKNTRSDEATNSSNKMQKVFGGIAEKLGDSLLNTLGAVYASEYILNMFSNAAPEQEENEVKEDFEYAHVITLRNQRPMGQPEYDAWSASAEGGAYPKPRLDYFYNAEVEYILFGKDEEKANANSAKVMLSAMLTVANYLQVRNDPELKSIAVAAATAAQALGVPTVVTKFLVFMGFAVAETAFDLHYLMRGYSIPAFSTQSQYLFLTHPGDPNAILKASTFKLSYEFYLRLRLWIAMMVSRDKTLMRTANLIQLNIAYAAANLPADKQYAGDAGFNIQEAYTTFSGSGGGKMRWWFMTQAIMGGARTEEGSAVIPEYKLVATY